MPKLRKLLLPFLLLIGAFVQAQSSVGKEFHTETGLPSNTVRTICTDDVGSVYIGTTSGIQISPENQPKNEYITKTVGRSQVWSIVHYNDWIYVGTYDSGLFIFNRITGSLYRKYSQKVLPGLRKIRVLKNKIVGIYREGAFEIRSLNLYKTFESPKENGKPILPIDIFTWKNQICIAHYTAGKNLYIWENYNHWVPAPTNFLPSTVLTGKFHNLVYWESHNQLFIGNDNNGFFIVDSLQHVVEYSFKLNDSKQSLQTWDITSDQDMVYIGVGNHLNFNHGFIWKHKPIPLDKNYLQNTIAVPNNQFIHYPICLSTDNKSHGLWYGSLNDGAYFLKDYKSWIIAPSEYIGLKKIRNSLFTWSKHQLYIYRDATKNWVTIPTDGCVKKILETHNHVFIQTENGIFLLEPNAGNKLKKMYTGNTDQFFHIDRMIYWTNYFGSVWGFNPETEIIEKAFSNLESVVCVEPLEDFAIAIAANQKAYILKNKKATIISGNFPSNLTNTKIFFYGSLLVVNEYNKLTFYQFSKDYLKATIYNTIDLNKISLRPISWISANQNGLWFGINNTLIQLGINQQFPHLNLISEYYLGKPESNQPFVEKSQTQIFNGFCYRKSGIFVEVHPVQTPFSLGENTDWQVEYGSFKVFKEDLLPSIREGQNFKLRFRSNDYIFQKNGFLLTSLAKSDTSHQFQLHHIEKDFWINDLMQGEYQLSLISIGKKMALPLIVIRRLLLNNLFWLLLALIVFMGIYIIYLSQQEKYSLQQRLIGLELATLKSNLNPHFIFNMMNLVQSMIVRSEQKKALKAISELAKINRLFLETSNKELITLAEEIDFAKKYMSLEQMRFEEDKQFTFKISIEPNIELNTWLLPPLIAQPLLENALKHGVLLTKSNPVVGISISLSNPFTLNILIYNSLPESNMRKLEGTNMGIHLVTERLKWVNEKYNEIQTVKMDVLPKMNNEFQVLITITKKDATWLENL